MQDGFVFSHLFIYSNLFLSLSLSLSISGSEQHQVLSIQNSHEAAAGSEGSEMYVQYFTHGIFLSAALRWLVK